jgi:long-chain fatty acid transport protein
MRRLSLFLTSLFVSHSAFAAAFQFYELGTPIVGTADVGQAAVANDASTSYFNPAGMSQLNSTQFMIGSQVMLPYTDFSIGSQNTISGDSGGGNAASLTPGVDLYYVYNYSPKLKIGASFTAPYGGVLNYTNGWVGRYNVQNISFYALDLNPAISYSVNQWLALGLGATLEYANLNQTVAIPIPGTTIDGQADIKVSNFAPGYNLGVMLTPSQTTKLGLAYRSQIVHNLSGNTTFTRLAANPTTKTRMTMPQNIIISLDQALSDKFNLLGELGWANWASMHATTVNIAGYSATTTLNWNDTYRLGLGAQYKATSAMTLQAGVSYDSSPTKSSLRTPDLPMDRQIRVGAGVMYSVMQAIKLGFSYEYLNLGSAPINNTSAVGTLQGNYSRNYANVFQASINIIC